MEDTANENPEKKLPFNNLYLISGLINGLNAGWMYLITIGLLFTGYFLFQSIILYPLMNLLLQNGYSLPQITENSSLLFDSKALGIDRNIVLLLELGMFVFGFVGLFVGVKYIHKKTLTSILTGYEKFRYHRFWFAFTIWAVLLLLLTLYTLLTAPEELKLSFNLPGFLISLVLMLTLMPIQTGFEELVFRGYVVQGLAQVFRNGIIPMILMSVLFGLAHMGNPEVKEFGWPIMLMYYCSFAFFLGALTLLDEGLELAFGIHFANNLVSSVLVSSSHSVIKTYAIFESDTQDPYSEIITWSLMATVTFLIFKFRYRWKDFSLLIK